MLYAVQRFIWRRFKPRTRGVKIMLFDADGRILLIRNSYGDTQAYVLPGGGVHPFESPERAAHREVREELSCGVSDLNLVATHYSEREGKRDSIWLFEGRANETPKPDPKEVAEAVFFAPDQLPERVSPATARRIAERAGKRPRTAAW
jgi:ADP-ribose pyrophosphatase YjhB (NUDIX family)